MSRRGHYGRDLASFERARASEGTGKAEAAARAAWRALAKAGAPRTPKTDRERLIEAARLACDSARGHLTEARINYGDLLAEVERVEAAWEAKPAAARADGYGRPDPSKKAGITQLRPVVEELTADVRSLSATLAKYRGTTARSFQSFELETARRFQPWLSTSVKDVHSCNWCGKLDDKLSVHNAIDGEGFAVRREAGTRFACYSCFVDGRDLADPAPKPVKPAEAPRRAPDAIVDRPSLPPRGEGGPVDVEWSELERGSLPSSPEAKLLPANGHNNGGRS